MRPLLLVVPLLGVTALADPLPRGWFIAGREHDYTAATAASGCGLPRSVVLESKPGVTKGWATAMELFQADPYRGKRLRFQATLATREVQGRAGLWMRVDGARAHEALAFDNMQSRPVKGTTACAAYEVVLDVPAGAVTVAAGVVLEGSGRVELGAVKFEVEPLTVATTNLLGLRGLTLGAPGLRPEEKANELADSLGRVGGAWFNDFAVQDLGVVLHQRNPARWSDAPNDSVATLEGNKVTVELGGSSGVFRFRRDGEATVIDGEWGKTLKYPVSIRLSPERLDMKWGFYERHLEREDSPQVDPACVRFIEYKGTIISPSDSLYVCGVALEAGAPPVQTTIAFLLTGFRRTLQGPGSAPY